jgi:small subunit ribosomal protein S1
MTGNEDFASLFGEFEKKQGMTSKKEPRTGDKVIGTVVSIQSDNIFIDLGSKTEGIVEREELTDDEGNLTVEVGDSIEIVVQWQGRKLRYADAWLPARQTHAWD